MNEIAAILATVAASLMWAAWREHRLGNYRDKTLLAGFCITFTAASSVMAALA
ncbi:hypothetical protein [Massilia sp. CF038]|uniref:hypothetical protein n=1 Tax=Massilia sp. CF038 TaxID=1881045 RepID=UPI00091EB632|nr:hypothetical protein [Massilia sp. CF038]SHG61808.1 hypothetical protein SAMN05428948_1306 [Massilia sp. CF038]